MTSTVFSQEEILACAKAGAVEYVRFVLSVEQSLEVVRDVVGRVADYVMGNQRGPGIFDPVTGIAYTDQKVQDIAFHAVEYLRLQDLRYYTPFEEVSAAFARADLVQRRSGLQKVQAVLYSLENRLPSYEQLVAEFRGSA